MAIREAAGHSEESGEASTMAGEKSELFCRNEETGD